MKPVFIIAIYKIICIVTLYMFLFVCMDVVIRVSINFTWWVWPKVFSCWKPWNIHILLYKVVSYFSLIAKDLCNRWTDMALAFTLKLHIYSGKVFDYFRGRYLYPPTLNAYRPERLLRGVAASFIYKTSHAMNKIRKFRQELNKTGLNKPILFTNYDGITP